MRPGRAESVGSLRAPRTKAAAVGGGDRSAGILLHLTSLPGRYGSGDLGREAGEFADSLGRAGVRWWQMLPVGPIGAGNSPYSSTSAFAGEPILISLDRLADGGLLARSDLRPPAKALSASQVKYSAVARFRRKCLRTAWRAARDGRKVHRDAVIAFRDSNRTWLDDFALFSALSRNLRTADWSRWPQPLRTRRKAALNDAARALADEIDFAITLQYWFDRDWRTLRDRCRAAGVGLIGDLPIFVGHASAEVWANPELFQLDARGRPTAVSGCPPDQFSRTGQLWGHPQYRWAAHRRERFAWWVRRFASVFSRFDAVRVDHFLGFHRAWSVPAAHKTAARGRFVPSPGEPLFRAVMTNVGRRLIIAEDLGATTPEALALRDEFGFPGMRVLQFGFDGADDYHQPHALPRHCVAYSGTHDNDTLRGWLDALRLDPTRGGDGFTRLERVNRYFGGARTKLHDQMIEMLLQSEAEIVVLPAQDVLDLAGAARFNTPGVARGNWEWRMRAGGLGREAEQRLAKWITASRR